MSKFDIRPQFENRNRLSNVKIQYSASVRMSKYDIRPVLNVKLGFQIDCHNFDIRP